MEINYLPPPPGLSTPPSLRAQHFAEAMAMRVLQRFEGSDENEDEVTGGWIDFEIDDDEDRCRSRHHTDRRYRRPIIKNNRNRRH